MARQNDREIATLLNEIGHLKQDLDNVREANRLHISLLQDRLENLEKYKAKTERYGWFLSGVFAVGVALAANADDLSKKITTIMGRVP